MGKRMLRDTLTELKASLKGERKEGANKEGEATDGGVGASHVIFSIEV